MGELAELNRRFALAGHLRFQPLAAGLVVAAVDNAQCTARISLQGGQLLEWQPKDQAQPVLWLSPRARFAPATAIRGGIPLCWPWFGAHPEDVRLPAHGLARTCSWRVVATAASIGGTEIVLGLDADAATRALLPPNLSATLTIRVGETLQLALTTVNDGDRECAISEALHSYFRIGDIGAVRVCGLEDAIYVDKLGGGRHEQRGPIAFAGELDRVYLDTRASCVVEDAQLRRWIRIDKSGSASTVVWSPGADKAGRMADLGSDAWRTMVCVESANALDDRVLLAPGQSHTLAIALCVGAL